MAPHVAVMPLSVGSQWPANIVLKCHLFVIS
jgi:hypothetical protein